MKTRTLHIGLLQEDGTWEHSTVEVPVLTPVDQHQVAAAFMHLGEGILAVPPSEGGAELAEALLSTLL